MAFSAMNYLLNIFPRYFELHVCVILPDANPCNSRYRGKMFLYIDHSHIEYLQYYILIVKWLIKTEKNINKCKLTY
jgi:hypothetical protein